MIRCAIPSCRLNNDSEATTRVPPSNALDLLFCSFSHPLSLPFDYAYQLLSLVLPSLNILYPLLPSPFPPSFFELTRFDIFHTFHPIHTYQRPERSVAKKRIHSFGRFHLRHVCHLLYRACNINRKCKTILVLYGSRAMIDDVPTMSNLTPMVMYRPNPISHHHSLCYNCFVIRAAE